MSAPNSPTDGQFFNKSRKRTTTTSSVAQSVQSVANEVLQSDPPLGFFAATAQVASQAPTLAEIRRGSFGTEGWTAEAQAENRRRRTLSQSSKKKSRPSLGSRDRSSGFQQEHAAPEAFPALTEEPTRMGSGHAAPEHEERRDVQRPEQLEPSERYKEKAADIQVEEPESSLDTQNRADEIRPLAKAQRVYTSGYIPPPTLPWKTATLVGLKAFWKWFTKPFGFLLTVYALNVVAWGGMLFLLLCNASKQMCWAPIHNAATEGSHTDANSLKFGSEYPRYYNCNDLNSPRRIWLEIDSQILNALFCVTGFGLAPWRFRDLYYLLRWRCTSEKSHGREKKMYGLRILAGYYRNWVRLPGHHTLDELTAAEYARRLPNASASSPTELEAALSALPESDVRLPLPLAKSPEAPLTGVRAPPTALWKLDFFVWCMVWNTFLQVVLCFFMWHYDRYLRPSWSTGLFIVFACLVAAVGGWVSFKEGGKVKRVEGVRAKSVAEAEAELGIITAQREEPSEMERTRTGEESVHLAELEKGKGKVI